MLLDASAAKALAMIVLGSTQGLATFHGLPLKVEDQGASWLVRSTPYTDRSIQSRFVTFSIFFQKDSAEIIGIGFEARFILSADEEKRARAEARPLTSLACTDRRNPSNLADLSSLGTSK